MSLIGNRGCPKDLKTVGSVLERKPPSDPFVTTGKSGWENFSCQGFRQHMETMDKREPKDSEKLELSHEYKKEVQHNIKRLPSVNYQGRAGSQKPFFSPSLSTPSCMSSSRGHLPLWALHSPISRAVLTPSLVAPAVPP